MRHAAAIVLSFAAGVAVAVPGTVVALTGSHPAGVSGSLDEQQALVINDPGMRQPHSQAWVDVDGLSGLLVCAQNEVSATLTVSPLEREFFRVVVDGVPLKPSRLLAVTSPVPLSGTWVGNVSSGAHSLSAQWRSYGQGRPLWLARATLNIQYELGTSCT